MQRHDDDYRINDKGKVSALQIMRERFMNREGHGLDLNDATFTRYLKAREYDIEKACAMLEATLQWRKDFDVESICKNWRGTIEIENESGKAYIRGNDRSGRALMVLRPSAENTFNHEGNIKHLVYTMEKAVACTHKKGQEKVSLLIDFDGYSFFNAPSIQTSHESVCILQNHYPERLHRAYFVRPPSLFFGLLHMLEPFIDSVTFRKVCFLSEEAINNPGNQLHQDVDKSLLEPCFGGNDSRPFKSYDYVRGAFDEDYLAILTKKKAKSPL